jgi:hypothetical protein
MERVYSGSPQRSQRIHRENRGRKKKEGTKEGKKEGKWRAASGR